MSLVLDSSATLPWIYAEETTNSERHIFDIVAEDGAVVPAIWRLEVANSLTVAARRTMFTPAKAGAYDRNGSRPSPGRRGGRIAPNHPNTSKHKHRRWRNNGRSIQN